MPPPPPDFSPREFGDPGPNLFALLAEHFGGQEFTCHRGRVFTLEDEWCGQPVCALSPVRVIKKLGYGGGPGANGLVTFRFGLSEPPDALWLALFAGYGQRRDTPISGRELSLSCHPESLAADLRAAKAGIEQANARYQEAVPFLLQLAQRQDRERAREAARDKARRLAARRAFDEVKL